MVRPPFIVVRHLLVDTALAVALPAAMIGCAGRAPSIADAGPPGPSLEFVALAASVGCDADADADADGIQLEVTVQLGDDDGSGFTEVRVANAANGAAAVAALADGAATALIDVAPGVAPAVDNALTATSENAAGVVLEATAVVAVDCELPAPVVACTFTTPTADTVIATDRVDVAIGCSSSGLNAAQRAMMAAARLRIDAVATGDGETRSQELDLVDGVAAGTVLLPGSGPHALTATVVDPDGLFDPDPSTTVSIDVQP